MKSLTHPNFHWEVFIPLILLIRLVYFDLSIIGWVALVLSVYQFMLLFDAIGHFIPVRYLLGSFMCLQFFVGPTFAYNGAEEYAYFMYKMKVPELEYFSYAIPAVLSFIIGLHLFAGNLDGEKIDEARTKRFVKNNPRIPYIFIVVGFISSFVSQFVASELAFVLYLVGSFKFIGLFMLILADNPLKTIYLYLIGASIVSSSLGQGMFHDLLTWTIFTVSVISIKYKFSIQSKVIGAIVFLVGVIILQSLKGSYREAISVEGGGVETMVNVYEQENEQESLFSLHRIASNNTRINQGFIITNIMTTVPAMEPYSNGAELRDVIEAAILPRFLAPNKLKAGDNELFTKYSGIRLRSTTSMSLSSLGDAYINFGIFGGCVFMFFLGLFYSGVLTLFQKNSKQFPILILFTALVFYYPIRPDAALQTILGHVVKSLFVIFMLVVLWKNNFYDVKKKKLSKA